MIFTNGTHSLAPFSKPSFTKSKWVSDVTELILNLLSFTLNEYFAILDALTIRNKVFVTTTHSSHRISQHSGISIKSSWVSGRGGGLERSYQGKLSYQIPTKPPCPSVPGTLGCQRKMECLSCPPGTSPGHILQGSAKCLLNTYCIPATVTKHWAAGLEPDWLLWEGKGEKRIQEKTNRRQSSTIPPCDLTHHIMLSINNKTQYKI